VDTDGVVVPFDRSSAGAPSEEAVTLRDRSLAALKAVPDVFLLCARLVRDPRVPRAARLLAAGALGYAVLPVDLVPDWIPVVGRADDLALAVFALNVLVRSAGDEVVRDHWDGPDDMLEAFTGLVAGVGRLIPARLRWLARAVER
jgi:uncharacterized membrane protein YkvA (DUF1232 family)